MCKLTLFIPNRVKNIDEMNKTQFFKLKSGKLIFRLTPFSLKRVKIQKKECKLTLFRPKRVKNENRLKWKVENSVDCWQWTKWFVTDKN